MRYLALEIIREGSGRSGRQKAGDLSIGVPLPRSHEGIEDAPQNACALGDAFAFGVLADKRAEISVVCRVTHDHLQVFSVELFSTVHSPDRYMVLRMGSDKRRSLSR